MCRLESCFDIRRNRTLRKKYPIELFKLQQRTETCLRKLSAGFFNEQLSKGGQVSQR